MTANLWTIASGATLYAGCAAPPSGMPAWRQAQQPGTFMNLSTNTMLSTVPPAWNPPSGFNDTNGAPTNWGMATFASGFGPLGAYILRSSGHLAAGLKLWPGITVLPLDTLTMELVCAPPQAMIQQNSMHDAYGEVVLPPCVGYIYPAHGYNGDIYLTPAESGKPKGSLLTLFFGGTPPCKNVIHEHDLSLPNGMPTRWIDNVPMTSATAAYPAAIKDSARGLIWVTTYDLLGPLSSIRIADKVITQYPSVTFNGRSDLQLALLPAPWDCLLAIGRGTAWADSPRVEDIGIYVCPFINNVPQGFTKITTSGEQPNAAQCSGEWVPRFGALTSFEGGNSSRVHRLTPPAPANMKTAPWVWSSESPVGVGGVAFSVPGNNPNNQQQYPTNGNNGKFRYAPSVEAFIYLGSVEDKAQSFVLEGMTQ